MVGGGTPGKRIARSWSTPVALDNVVPGVDIGSSSGYLEGSERSREAVALERLVVAVLEIDQILDRLLEVRGGVNCQD